ncbi:MAG: YczE/YyaS/YitT family protein [Peptococcaceae bacterium]
MDLLKKLLMLIFGLFIFSMAIVLTIGSRLGASPWDVFHLGILNYSTLSLGQISQIAGLVIILLAVFLGESPGIATILNMYLVGVFIDLLLNYRIIPVPHALWQQYFMNLLGIYFFGWGTYFYMQAGLGSGPRDSLMLGLIKKTGKPVWMIRTFLEAGVLLIGYLLGGLVGIGTVMVAGLVGFSIQHVFSIMKSDPAEIRHATLGEYYLLLKKSRQIKEAGKASE